MPIFNRKFETKPIPARVLRGNSFCPIITEDLNEYRTIGLNLGSRELRFVDGLWVQGHRKSEIDDAICLNRRLKVLEEQNNMNELKIEILLDLLTEHANELNFLKQQKK